jgi:ketosteroid isomerase-like protein
MAEFEAEEDAAGIANRFFDALGRGDRAGVVALVSDEAILWQNYDNKEKPFSQRIDNLMRASGIVKGFRYTDRRYTNLSDGALLQHTLAGRAPDGSELSVPISVRMYTRAGRIVRLEEYLDREALAPLYRAMAR